MSPVHTAQPDGRRSVVLVVVLLSSCTYLKYAAVQAEYKRLQKTDPSQRNLKHMIERPNFAVIGRTSDPEGLYGRDRHTMAIAAYSSALKANELVDVMHDVGVGTHFGLALPAGRYEILALSDRDDDGVYEHDEVVGRSRITLAKQDIPSMVVTRHLIELRRASLAGWPVGLAVKRNGSRVRSVYFPAGTIRQNLDDPVFSSDVATLGLYDPAAFFEQVPTLFYALEEHLAHKIPVVFVHGIGGSPREFTTLVRRLDRTRFQPWFYYYPSGGDLDQLAQLFYEIFLSGDKVARNEHVPTVIVAHSMGGLVVRKALEALRSDGAKYPMVEFISLATPFGGHPSARSARHSRLMILPSWRSLDPEGEFIQRLYRRPLPACVTHRLFYAYRNDSLVKLGRNSDGVVPMSSQLHPPAQEQSDSQLGLNVSHTGMLHAPAAVDAIIKVVVRVETKIPQEHLRAMRQGGFEVGPGGDYGDLDRYFLRHYGRYLQALARGEIRAVGPWLRRLVPMLRGETEPVLDPAKAWLKFTRDKRFKPARRE